MQEYNHVESNYIEHNCVKNKYVESNYNLKKIFLRNSIEIDTQEITTLIKSNVILITGGGGSIGSELCRQIVKYSPKHLVIFDIYENNLYEIETELKQNCPNIQISAIVGSIRDRNKLIWLFETYRPNIVFHAAAHKHVPLMEKSPIEAIKNNVFGTNNMVDIADEFKTEKFVLISTDKAVNPTSIMGATKQICEMIITAKNEKSLTDFIAVRFGNVLQSNGSVIPLFKKQIKNGGPVTVTDKNVTRFFMTITEAVELILQAASRKTSGEIFVLDMGEPINIYNLAKVVIEEDGFIPEKDIPIKIIGLRPGEKLYEEILTKEEGTIATKHNKIFISKPIEITEEELKEKLSLLRKITYNENISIEEIKKIMKNLVKGYHEEHLT